MIQLCLDLITSQEKIQKHIEILPHLMANYPMLWLTSHTEVKLNVDIKMKINEIKNIAKTYFEGPNSVKSGLITLGVNNERFNEIVMAADEPLVTDDEFKNTAIGNIVAKYGLNFFLEPVFRSKKEKESIADSLLGLGAIAITGAALPLGDR
ncbi:hypothetical protein [Vibrio alginolyticus]|uniref:hypothetical protein n=1 Tax=Vibrio alginolyticus TaxID=663 RepID=UPI0006CA736B|nr:hypothetical protein [Vibrio alginolyticus]KPM95041.1 hypothetical protein AOG25_26470 [Vibrio alginolyticus]